MMINKIVAIIKHDALPGVLLIAAAMAAIILANSPLSSYYDLLLDMPIEVHVGPLHIAKPMLLWINDGLMAVFFFIVGLELKREMVGGELSTARAIALPAAAAVGGMAVPALIYVAINAGDVQALRGWAIPTATDIAFALGILSLLGSRVPVALKTFLVSLAIFDDIGAIIIIALFYSAELSTVSLVISFICIIMLYLLNRTKVYSLVPYLFVGLIMWTAVLKSGVHATLAGVVLAMFIPLAPHAKTGRMPLKEIEHDLHAFVAFCVLPLFAFANSGLNLSGVGSEALLHPVTFGIALGLFIGKQLGVFSFAWIAVRMHIATLPTAVNWSMIYGVALLCGIGFTMSLFIGSLAFSEAGEAPLIFDERLGIIIASLLSSIAGYIWLNRALKRS